MAKKNEHNFSFKTQLLSVVKAKQLPDGKKKKKSVAFA